MKIYPSKFGKKRKESFDELPPFEQKVRQAALVLAFVSVFIFLFKIVFF